MVLIAAVGYLGYVYWPILSSYISGPAKIRPELTKVAAMKTTTTIVKAKAKAALTTVGSGVGEAEPKKIKLVDPFTVRVALRSKVEPEKPDQKDVRVLPDPVLEGIWVDTDMKVAFISGQALIEGGKVLGWTVKRITKTHVLLVKGGRRKILKLEGIQ